MSEYGFPKSRAASLRHRVTQVRDTREHGVEVRRIDVLSRSDFANAYPEHGPQG
jgi:hypothetical protein